MKLNRRQFLSASALSLLLSRCNLLLAESSKKLTEQDLRLLGAVLQHLFPEEAEAPGALQINSLGHVLRSLEDERIPLWEREKLPGGLLKLRRFLDERGIKSFESLSNSERETLLRDFSQTQYAKSWLSLLLSYTLEACFADPCYGVNREEKAWQWISHKSGFPRPAKPYDMLNRK